MNTLRRTKFDRDGVFGEFTFDGDDHPTMVTLEHSYSDNAGPYYAKLQPGTYKCVRGKHVLHSGPIETFEITGVEGHSGILFHVGNYNDDSEGCVLLGKSISSSHQGGELFITSSKEAWHSFMTHFGDTDTFDLEVI